MGIIWNEALDNKLSPPDLIPTGAFVGNKILYTALLNRMGLPSAETQAVASVNASFGALLVLRGAAVHIDRVADGKVCPGNGGQHDIDLFCSEIMAKFPGGFLLQTALNPHPEMARVSGSSIGCVRMVTVNDTGQPRPLHALWKIPSPDDMSDNFWQSGSMLAALELDTGRVLSCSRGTGPDTEEITTHPVSGVEIADMVLPHWDSVKTLAAKAVCV